MLTDIHPKYTLSVHPKEGRTYNPVHDAVDGAIATIIDLQIGERGWIAYRCDLGGWHRLHISSVEDVMVDENGNVEVTTLNTMYRLEKIH